MLLTLLDLNIAKSKHRGSILTKTETLSANM